MFHYGARRARQLVRERRLSFLLVLLGVSQNRVIIGKFPQELFIFWTRGGTPRRATPFHSAQDDNCISVSGASVWTSSGVGLPIYRAPFGVNYLQKRKDLFVAVQREVCLEPVADSFIQALESSDFQLGARKVWFSQCVQHFPASTEMFSFITRIARSASCSRSP